MRNFLKFFIIGLFITGGTVYASETLLDIYHGGTNQRTFSPNSIITSNTLGTGLMATSSNLTVSYIMASSTTATSTFFGGFTSGNNLALVVNAAAPANSLYVNSAGSVGIGTNLLTGAKFKVALSSMSVTDGYDNSSKIATLVNVAVASSKVKLIEAICGSYSVAGKGTDSGTTYGTVLAKDGKCWLRKNLGATNVASSKTDYTAYGSLYQWGRGTDGHQLRTCTSAGSCTSTNGSTFATSTTPQPLDALFIKNNTPNLYDWLTPQDNTLWNSVSSTNNPCPTGFRVPTKDEWVALASAEGITNGTSDDKAFASTLKLPLAGNRDYSSAGFGSLGSYGYYWSSTPGSPGAYYLLFSSSGVGPANLNNRAYGFSVRCLKD